MRYLYIAHIDKNNRIFKSKSYNYVFNMENGFLSRWGNNVDLDAEYSPFGPEILDIEITKNGCPDNCPYCYKSNTNLEPYNMTLDQFKYIIDLMPITLTQVALGITGVQSNPNLIPMMQYCRDKKIIPNLTLTGMDLTQDMAVCLAKLTGAVAISVKEHNPELGYNTIKTFTDLGIEQVNAHIVLYKESLPHIYKFLKDAKQDKRLEKLRAIVFLSLKQKGNALNKGFTPCSIEELKELVTYCLKNKINFGFDSCTGHKFIKVINLLKEEDTLSKDKATQIIQYVDPCESSLFSGYINEKCEWWGCSFCEDREDVVPINMLEVTDFLKEVWHSKPVKFFRNIVRSAHKCKQPCGFFKV